MSKKEKRKSRKKIVKKVDITKPLSPIDITKFGSDDDPCFGKLWDLTEDECKVCGDCTLCGIVYNQTTIKLREEEESNSRFKDLELDQSDPKEVKDYLKKLKGKGKSKLYAKRKALAKFNIDKAELRKIIKKLWK